MGIRHPRIVRRRNALSAILAVAALLIAGCANSGEQPATGAPTPSETNQTQAQASTNSPKTDIPASDQQKTAPSDASPKNDEFHVGIALIAQVETMNVVVDHFKEALKSAGYTNITYNEENAQGNMQTASLIVKQMLRNDPDLIFTIGTPLALSFLQAKPDVPIIFGAMTDPVGAGVVESFDHPGGMFTGTSDVVQASDVFDVITALVPDAKRIGFVGNLSEQNTSVQLDSFKAYGEKHGFTLTTAPVAKSSDLQLAIRSLEGDVDVLLAGTDNTVASAIATAGQAALAADLPFVMAAGEPPTAGLLATVGADYPQLGTESGEQAAKILGGADVSRVPVITPRTGGGYQVTVNTGTAEKLGVDVPNEILGSEPVLVQS